jgi:hypothetical protein
LPRPPRLVGFPQQFSVPTPGELQMRHIAHASPNSLNVCDVRPAHGSQIFSFPVLPVRLLALRSRRRPVNVTKAGISISILRVSRRPEDRSFVLRRGWVYP